MSALTSLRSSIIARRFGIAIRPLKRSDTSHTTVALITAPTKAVTMKIARYMPTHFLVKR